MPLNRDQAEPLARLLCALRPAWDYPGVVVALRRVVHRPETAEQIALAAIRAAADPDVRTPMVIPTDGSHWNDAKPTTPPKAPRLTREHECPRHAGQWADTCRSCAADKLAADTDDESTPEKPLEPTLAGYDPTAATIGAVARREAREKAARIAALNPTGHHVKGLPELVHVITDVPATATTSTTREDTP